MDTDKARNEFFFFTFSHTTTRQTIHIHSFINHHLHVVFFPPHTHRAPLNGSVLHVLSRQTQDILLILTVLLLLLCLTLHNNNESLNELHRLSFY